MQFTCENCQRRYSIPDDKVRGKQVKVRCKSCDHVTTVSLAPEPAPAAAAPPPEEREERTSVVSVQQLQALRKEATKAPAAKPKLDVSAQWFVMVKGAQVGPLDAGMLGAKFRAGELHGRSYIWKQGMGEWKRAEDIPEVAALLAPAPEPERPLPPPAIPKAPAKLESDFAVTRPAPAMKLPRVAEPVPEPAKPRAPEPQPVRSDPVRSEPVRSRVAEPIEAPAPAAAQELLSETDQPFNDESFDGGPTNPKQTAAAPSASLDTLFSDEDLPPPEQSTESPGTAKTKDEVADDPFAAVGGVDPNDLPPPGEATRFFMAQAGVTRRNPPWKIALFIAGGIGIPVLILFALSQLNVVPLTVTHVNAEGQEVKESVFSSGGITGLGDLLLGKKKKPQPEQPPQQTPEKKQQPQVAKKAPDEKQPPPEEKKGPSQEELAAFYGNNELKTVGPKVKIQAEKPALEKGSSGLDEEQVAKVVGQSMTAFQGCIESELRKNPNLKVGKITVSATVAASGTVTKAEIDKSDVSKSPLGDCLKNRARRMVFASFQGDEEAEIQIPLMVTTGM